MTQLKSALLRFLAISTAVLLLSAQFAVSAEPSKQPMNSKWELIAQSDLIARAKIRVPLNALEESLRTKNYQYITMQVEIEEPIKGHFPQQPSSLRYFTEPSAHSPSASFLEDYNEQEVILFMIQVDEAGVAGNYLAGHTPDAVSPFSADEFSEIANEVKNQQEIVQQFDTLRVGQTNPGDAKIRRLFDSLTKQHTQQAAWEQLLKLSRQDVPGIVRAMSDQRRLAEAYAYLPNKSPHAFEAIVQYGPPRIVEAASILLTYITGTSFRFVCNGGSERERLTEVNAWRCWCAYNSEPRILK